MQAIIERCCGLDVHQETVVACLLVGAPGAQPNKEVRTFRTVTRDLEALRDWLWEAGATHVGMESTGVYWRPDLILAIANSESFRRLELRQFVASSPITSTALR